MKSTIFKIIASIAVFLATLVVSGYFMNKGNVNTTKTMEKATLPVVYMNVGGSTVNTLYGYTQDMDVALLRDSITPLDEDRGVSFRVDKFGSTVLGLSVKLRTVEGDRLIENISISEYEEDDYSIFAKVTFKGLIEDYKEYCMEIHILTIYGRDIMYHTRVIDAPLYCPREKLAFILDFHSKAGKEETNEELKTYMESNHTGDNSTLAYVNIHSSMKQLAFADLNVYEITEPVATFKELALETAMFTIDYIAATRNGSAVTRYFVREYYRIKYTSEVTYLLDFERTMHEITEEDDLALTESTLTLGITNPELDLAESEDGNIFAFVSENKLYSYNISDNKLAKLFSFYNRDNFDARTVNGNHKIKTLRVDEAGNVWFLVYGYMNRGTYEGKVGITLYEYNGVTNVIDEKMFISSNSSSEMVIKDIDELSYLNKNNNFYFMLDRSIYSFNMDSSEITEMVPDLEENMYSISKSKSMLVWQTGNNVNASETLMVMNLNTGQINTTAAPEGEYIKPLAFMNEDLIYGLAVKSDVVTDGAGRTTFPMYELKIQNEYGEQLKTYGEPGIYVSDVRLKDNLLSMERVVKKNSEELKYEPYESDYMTNNQAPKQRLNVIQTAVDDLYETIVRIKFSHDTKGKLVMLSPETVIYEGSKELYLGKNATDKNHYYVYYKGELQTISTKAANAVIEANNNYGTVVDDKGFYVWIRANRALRNQIMDLSVEPNTEGEVDSVAWCVDRMLEYEGTVRNTEYLFSKGETVLSILNEALEDYNVCDLTGCPLDSVLYYVNRDIPVLALMNDGKAYLIIGYNQLSIVVLEPEKGWYKIGINEAETMFEANGNQFITYVPDK